MTQFLYEKSAAEIYRQSFAIIEAEADFSAFPAEDRPTVMRMIHACGQVDLARDIVIRTGASRAGAKALGKGAKNFVRQRHGRSWLATNDRECQNHRNCKRGNSRAGSRSKNNPECRPSRCLVAQFERIYCSNW